MENETPSRKRTLRDCLIQLLYDLQYLLANYFIAYLPCWTLRKLLYRAIGMKIGKGSRIAMRCVVLSPHKIRLGRGNVINEFALLDGRAGLELGDNNSVSMYAKLYTGTHQSHSDTFAYRGKPTRLADNCWIGTAAIVMPGSQICDFAIVGANSLFPGGVAQEKGIYQGVPAQYIKPRCIEKKYETNYLSFFR